MHSQQSSRYDSTWTDSAPGRTSRDSSISSTYTDEEEPDQRLKPFWLKYQHLFYDRGLYLDTIINAGKHVLQHPNQSQQYWPISWNTNDRSLYHDPSLVSSACTCDLNTCQTPSRGSLIVCSEAPEKSTRKDLSLRLFTSTVGNMK